MKKKSEESRSICDIILVQTLVFFYLDQIRNLFSLSIFFYSANLKKLHDIPLLLVRKFKELDVNIGGGKICRLATLHFNRPYHGYRRHLDE